MAGHFRRSLALGLISIFFVPQVQGDVSGRTGRRVIAQVEASAAYSLNLHGCPFEFDSRLGGYTDLNDPYEGFYRSGIFDWKHDKADLGLSFKCIQEPAAQLCPDELRVKENDPSTLRLMQVVRYKRIHPRYEGGAVATTFTAVNPPRGRQLQFCLGDGQRTLVGRSIVGNERSAFTAQVLRIIASIRFTDEQGPKK